VLDGRGRGRLPDAPRPARAFQEVPVPQPSQPARVHEPRPSRRAPRPPLRVTGGGPRRARTRRRALPGPAAPDARRPPRASDLRAARRRGVVPHPLQALRAPPDAVRPARGGAATGGPVKKTILSVLILSAVVVAAGVARAALAQKADDPLDPIKVAGDT